MEVELTRTVRFCLQADGSIPADLPVDNGYAGWPPMRGLGRYYELDITCIGGVNPVTGYLVNIVEIDRAVRERALPVISEAAQAPDAGLGTVMRRTLATLQDFLQGCVQRLSLRLTPTYRLEIQEQDMAHVLVSQMFEFSAAHRLNAPALSEEENQRIFGKCNNPNGHGHNYRYEVTVRCPVDGEGDILPVEQLDALVSQTIDPRFDHKHLNLDVPEFADVNPSVEHIAKEIFDLLAPEVRRLDVTLEQVRVWETEKTACTYRG